MIDTHCHFNLSEYFPDIDGAIHRAKAFGVHQFVVIGIDETSSIKAVELAEKHTEVYAAAGWHPTEVSGFNECWLVPIRNLLEHPKVVALGEIGLDYHWDKALKEDQFLALEAQIELANEWQKPIVFHCREANQDLIQFLKAHRPKSRFVLHCFSGSEEEAKEAVKLDAYFGFDGPITFPKSEVSRKVLKMVPRDRILIETDSPFLAPVPYRGKPNEPTYLRYVAEEVARCFETDFESAEMILDENARRFYGMK